jgi:glycosyltransferase involved in cell wall biosynthesis
MSGSDVRSTSTAAVSSEGGVPLVSVVVATYQHAPFIERCVRSILDQEGVDMEVLIGEDGSTDGTREICQALAADHPGKIRLFLRHRSDVLKIWGRATGRANSIALMEAARGRFIAKCDGDDQWIDRGKLKAQVALLSSRPHLSACFSQAWNEHEGQREPYYRPGQLAALQGRDITLADILAGWGIPTSTLVFRRDAMFPLPPELWTAPAGDVVQFLHLARHGDLAYLEQPTTVREVHPGGIHSMTSAIHKLEFQLSMIPYYRSMFGSEHGPMITVREVNILKELWELAVRARDHVRARRCLRRLRELRKEVGWSSRQWRRAFLMAHLPRLMAYYAQFRGVQTEAVTEKGG